MVRKTDLMGDEPISDGPSLPPSKSKWLWKQDEMKLDSEDDGIIHETKSASIVPLRSVFAMAHTSGYFE